MADTDYPVTDTWPDSPTYTASADVDALLSASGGYAIRWGITDDDETPPTSTGHPVMPGRSQAVQLKTGDCIWIRAEGSDTTATLGLLTP